MPAKPRHFRLHIGLAARLFTTIDYVLSWPYSEAVTLLACKLSTTLHPYDVVTETVERACALAVDTPPSMLRHSGEERLTPSDKDQVRQSACQPILLR